MPDLVLRERMPSFWQEWYCPVPPDGARYRVTREWWHYEEDIPVREIYALELRTGIALEVVMTGWLTT